MAMTVTVYRKSDGSAPNFDGSVGSLCTLLDACLVNGYGTKAAAGWALTDSATTNKRVYTNGTGSSAKKLFIDDTIGTAYANVLGYNNGTSIATLGRSFGLPTGRINKPDSSGDWVLIADAKRFILLVLRSTWVNCWVPHFFGDLSSWVGGDSDAGRCAISLPASDISPIFGWSTATALTAGAYSQYIYMAGDRAGTDTRYDFLSHQLRSANNLWQACMPCCAPSNVSVDNIWPNPYANGIPLRRYDVVMPSDGELMNGQGAMTRGTIPGWYFAASIGGAGITSWANDIYGRVSPFINNKDQATFASGPLSGKTFELYHIRWGTSAAVGQLVHAFEISDTWVG